MSEQDHPLKQRNYNVDPIASAIGARILRKNYDEGKTITFPSLGIALSKVQEALPELPKTADQIVTAFRATFPDAPIFGIPEDNPTVIIVEHEGAVRHPRWSNMYAAVNDVGSVPHAHNTGEYYTVVQGELVVSTKQGRDPVEKHFLQEAGQFTIMPGVIHSARAKEGWTIFQVASYPGWTRENHHIASEKVIAEFRTGEQPPSRFGHLMHVFSRN